LKIAWLHKPLPAALLLVLIWTGWRLAVLSHTGVPAPTFHDEFSYLLGADTFAHGRLANPPHALGRFFESLHILVRPVYASKYPPGQAMFLALGQKAFGRPFYGVLIGNALMLFTICLMLFAWVPTRWALAVSAMFALCLSPGMYWTDSYWGGSVAASGGALVLLGIGIYRKKQMPFAGAIFAIGALLLFWTRPFEGGVFVLMVLIVFAWELWQKRRVSALAIAFSLLAIGTAWTCYDDEAITGKPFRLPYLEYFHQYNMTPALTILPLGPEPAYTNPRMRAYHGKNGWEIRGYKPTDPRWLRGAKGLVVSMRNLSLWPAILSMLVVPVGWRAPLFRKMAVVAAVLMLVLGFGTFHFEHYSAPVWAALGLMVAVWAERAWDFRVRGLPVGRVLVALALVSPIIAAVAKGENLGVLYDRNPASEKWPYRRVALMEQLSVLNRRQLVFVRYPSPDWNIDEEWVYNGADIDQQRVVFAHDLGSEENRALLAYYPDRTDWLLTFDASAGRERIEPYPSVPMR
jgi:hypothetical protein